MAVLIPNTHTVIHNAEMQLAHTQAQNEIRDEILIF